MRRAIVDFHQDEHGDWVADLDCGHGQHVRHRPPFIVRPWVEDEDGRVGRLGTKLDCVRCDRMEWPDGAVAYRRTREFDQDTLPAGFLASHATKRGVWGRIHVLAGALRYVIDAPIERSFLIEAGCSGVIVPEVRHRVEPQGQVRFLVEFSRVEGHHDSTDGP